MRSSDEKRIWTGYLALEGIIFLVLMYTMVTVDHIVYDKIQFTLIAVNFIAMLLILKRYRNGLSGFRDHAIPLALTITMIADVFTCLVPDWYVLGVIAFCGVQTVYMLYLGTNKVNLMIRAVLYVALFVATKADSVFLYFACYSMANLIVNVITAWRRYATVRKTESDTIRVKTMLYFAIGITLFLGCDSSIGVRGLMDSDSLMYTVFNLMSWICYVPSQILINTAFFTNRPEGNVRNDFDRLS